MEKFRPKLMLCPTDFSDEATFALHYAKELAIGGGARLIVLYADLFLPPPFLTEPQVAEVLKAWESSKQKQAAHEHLVRYVQGQVGNAGVAETVVVEALPASAIIQTAEQKNVDLIVMGTHGRSGVRRILLGSVTERVLHETDRPVLTVRNPRAVPEPSRFRLQRILCPVNFTEVAVKAFDYAVSLAESFGAELTVLYVADSLESERTGQSTLDRLCVSLIDEAPLKYRIKSIVRQGNAAEQIIDLATSLGSDLIVLGSQHKRFLDTTVIGTTTVRVTRHAPCPVLTVIRR